MDITYKILLGFIGLIIIRFLLNFSKFLYLRKVLIKQKIFVNGSFKGADTKAENASQKAGDWVQENQIEIKKVVLETGIQDQRKSYMESLGMNYAQQQNISALDNLVLLNSEIMGTAIEILKRAKGFYKIQALKCFNPLFWIEFIIFLPKEFLKYLGVNENAKSSSVLIKVFQILYWIASVFFMYQTYLKNS